LDPTELTQTQTNPIQIMKFPDFLQITGAVVLLASMAFALIRVETTDTWIPLWLPCVGMGVALAFLGTILSTKGKEGSHE
jgi:hypothetical protein